MVVITPKKPKPSRLEQIRSFGKNVAAGIKKTVPKLSNLKPTPKPERVLSIHTPETDASKLKFTPDEGGPPTGTATTEQDVPRADERTQQLDFPDKQEQAAGATQLVSFLGETFPLLEETESAYIVLRDKGDGILSRYRISKKN